MDDSPAYLVFVFEKYNQRKMMLLSVSSLLHFEMKHYWESINFISRLVLVDSRLYKVYNCPLHHIVELIIQ